MLHVGAVVARAHLYGTASQYRSYCLHTLGHWPCLKMNVEALVGAP